MAAWARRADAAILWTSGSTGVAKGVVKSGRAVIDNTLRTQRAMCYRSDDVLAPWLPFSHQYGLSMVLLWWMSGCTLAVTPYRRLDLAVADLAHAGTTVVDATPPTYHALLALLRRRPRLAERLGPVRMWCVGGAPLPTPLAEAFKAAVGRPLLNGYGLTEFGNVALATAANPTACGPPLPGVEVRVVGTDGRPVPASRAGEVEVRTPDAMHGYLDGEGRVEPVTGTWFATGDLGRLDDAGNLEVWGRKEAVHRLGHTVYPASIEARAQTCGRPVKVVVFDDERRGSLLAFVVADPDGRSVRWWRSRICAVLPVYEQPNTVHVVAELPLTGRGKVDLARLRVVCRPPHGSTGHRTA
jgi:acyl-CoA synthetase (AMP-forming)/AMP-acid ligase II